MSNASTIIPPTPVTKKRPAPKPQRADGVALAPDAATLASQAPDLAALNYEAQQREADLAQQEAQLAAQLREISERRANAQRARALLEASTSRERQEAARQAAAAERASQRAAHDRDVATRQELFAEAERLTAALVAVIAEATEVDSRIYAASLTLGIAQQRSGYAKRALTDHIGYHLNARAGLRDMPLGRSFRTLTGDGGAG